MADSARPLNRLALALALLVLLAVSAPLWAVAARATGFDFAPADASALRFTVMQAAVSALVSTLLAIPVARALARRRFAGRGLLITLMGAPFLLPAIVAVIGLLAVFGRSGAVSDLGVAMGFPRMSIYGLHGVVIAHVFLNLPLAVRMILQGWQAIPAERLRLAEGLGFGPAEIARHLEWPMLRHVLPGAAMLIFAICLTSFAVALTMGGGPAATTVELAIYQALRFDFDLGRAALLALVQFAICGLAVALAWVLARPVAFGMGLDRSYIPVVPGGWRKLSDLAVIAMAALFLLVPLGAIVLRGLPGLATLPASVWASAMRSVLVAVASTGLTVVVALVLAMAVATRSRTAGVMEAAATLPLAASGLVLGTGLFLIILPIAPPQHLSLAVTIGVNAVLALPFVYRLLLPQAQSLVTVYGQLADSLGMRGWSRWRWLVLPRLARPLGLGAGIAAALSMGDLGVIALFASDDQATLPLMVQRLMGAYRTDDAAGAALVLLILSFGLFWICDWGGRRAAA